MVKKSKGRQKIEMVKMKNESNLQVTFSKRRAGLFKKASELCTLCGAEIAMIVFSPGRKVFSFGHPNVETVIDRFLNNNPPPPPPHQHNNMQLADARRNSVVRDLNDHLTEVMNQLEYEKKKNEELKMMREKAKSSDRWWENGTDGLTFGQLNVFQGKLDNLKEAVTRAASNFFQANVPHQNYYGASSSNAAGFGIDGGSNTNPDVDLFGQRRMVNLNAFTNQNMVLPNHALHFGNNGNVSEGFVPEYNVHSNQNQSQNLSFKTENISDYENHHHGHPPHPGPGHC